ncbi:MAG: hypothetical protein RBR16_07760 [Syntrophus sp. (in: bacteria)]|jgi:hypothetical protein|nr:hypothetical protein [Syntrophus sp. (in: bacteria)]
MTALSADKKTQYTEGVELSLPVGADKTIYAGSLVVLDGTTKLAEAGSDTASKVFVGVAREAADNADGAASAINVTVRRRGLFLFNKASAVQTDVGKAAFISDDQTVALAATTDNDIYCGVIAALESTTQVWVDIYPALLQTDVATHVADTASAHAASAIAIEDDGTFTAKTDVEEALQEIYQHILSAQALVEIPIFSFAEADGTALAAFADGDSTTPGYALVDSKALGIRWNNHAEPDPIGASVVIPPDFDNTADAVLHILASKSGATLADAVKFTCTAYNVVAGALHDADTNFGGDSGAMTGNATAKTVQEVTLTLALANLAAAPGVIALTIQPKDGTLGTDDVIIHGVWIEYKRKLLTA